MTIQPSEGDVIDATAVPTSRSTASCDLRADGTTFSGFAITGNGDDVGISISGQGVMASGDAISSTLTGIQTTTHYVTGNVTISGNTIKSQYGISLQNAGDTVTDNTVTASIEGVGLIHSANTRFSGNTFDVGAAGNAWTLRFRLGRGLTAPTIRSTSRAATCRARSIWPAPMAR